MSEVGLRQIERADWPQVADLIEVSFNGWYTAHGMPPAFKSGSGVTRLLCEIYEALDPGCCVLAQDESGRLLGVCFYHPRQTHLSLGVLGVHPEALGRGVGGRLLRFVIELAEREQKPLRLLSSALNLDSFALYTRAGFVPRAAFQAMFIKVPEDGFDSRFHTAEIEERVRQATLDDLPAIVALEWEIAHSAREQDYRYFIDNQAGLWQVLVYENGCQQLEGVLVSISHPGRNMLGPGVMRTQDQAAALIVAQLNQHRGRSPVLLISVECESLVQQMYGLGARVFELYFQQVRGVYQPSRGVIVPTLLPETG